MEFIIVHVIGWSDAEVSALVEFILLHCKGDKWPTHHNVAFWSSAASFITMRTGGENVRTGIAPAAHHYDVSNPYYIGNACRFKVAGWLKKKYPSPLDYQSAKQFTSKSTSTQTDTLLCSVKETQTDMVSQYHVTLEKLSLDFSHICEVNGLDVPKDFLLYASAAMSELAKQKRSNVLYNFAKGVGTKREGQDESRFPTRKMPMGLVEYITNFFVADDMNHVSH